MPVNPEAARSSDMDTLSLENGNEVFAICPVQSKKHILVWHGMSLLGAAIETEPREQHFAC